jgi:hypothetical protein
MSRHLFEVADVFRRHGEAFFAAHGESVTSGQRRILHALTSCRTAALGGHVDACDSCGHAAVSYNSCRNRHCPKCLAGASARWLEERQAELLPVPYFHVVFTLPAELAPIALQTKKVVYGLLFDAASRALLTIAADPRHLGAQITFLAILHTWGQNLHHHPHIHCVVPGGGLAPDRSQWIACREKFFLPVRVLSSLYRGKLLDSLNRARERGDIGLHGEQAHLADPARWKALLKRLRAKQWVVYAKPPFGGPEQVLKYLARYTHRVAISNSRIVSIDDDSVVFRWKDYADENRQRTMKLNGAEFIRRFLMHALPSGFVRIRHFGLFANSVRAANLELCRRLVPRASASSTLELPAPKADREVSDETVRACPVCTPGRMRFQRDLRPFEIYAPATGPADTS